jgi:hypothetical protein
MTRSRFSRIAIRTAVPAAAIAAGLAFAGTANASTVTYGAYDSDGNGYTDTYSFDASGDGYDDVLAFDYDETGYVEQVAVDNDLDGYLDTWVFDFDEDALPDQVAIDSSLDGSPDIWGDDSDLDGYIDTIYYDTDGDGYSDTYEYADPTSYVYQELDAILTDAYAWDYWYVTDGSYGFASDDTSGVSSLAGDGKDKVTTAPTQSSDMAQDALEDLLPALF